jgi:hypothetical protein
MSFDDASPTDNGMANLGAALWQAPVQAAAIRDQREQQMWQRDHINAEADRRDRHDMAAEQAQRDALGWQQKHAGELMAERGREADDRAKWHKDELDQRNAAEGWKTVRGASSWIADRMWPKPHAESSAHHGGTGWHQKGDEWFRTNDNGDLEKLDQGTGKAVPMSGPGVPGPAPKKLAPGEASTGFHEPSERSWYNPKTWEPFNRMTDDPYMANVPSASDWNKSQDAPPYVPSMKQNVPGYGTPGHPGNDTADGRWNTGMPADPTGGKLGLVPSQDPNLKLQKLSEHDRAVFTSVMNGTDEKAKAEALKILQAIP